MKRNTIAAAAILLVVAVASPAFAQRGRAGGGRGGVGGSRGSGMSGGNRGNYATPSFNRPTPAMSPPASRPTAPVQRPANIGSRPQVATQGPTPAARPTPSDSGGHFVPPPGSNVNVKTKGGSYTTKGGTTITGGAAVGGGTGADGGKAAGGGKGVVVQGPGGKTVVKSSAKGAGVGPGGTVAAGGRSGTTVAGEGGAAHVGRGGAVVAGQGGVAAKGHVAGIATGPSGTAAGVRGGAFRAGPGGVVGRGGAIGVGPNGGFVGRRTGFAYGPGGAVVGSRVNVNGQFYASRYAAVRGTWGHWDYFRAGWWAGRPGCWHRPWIPNYWAWMTWAAFAPWYGIVTEPIVYNFGDNVYYDEGTVYVSGQPVGTDEEYYSQIQGLAEEGETIAEGEDWQNLGVFALVAEGESESQKVFQLAVNKEGAVRGNFTDTVDEASQPIVGYLDKGTQRICFTVGDDKETVFETGIANLTNPEASVMIHFGAKTNEVWTFVRLEEKAS